MNKASAVGFAAGLAVLVVTAVFLGLTGGSKEKKASTMTAPPVGIRQSQAADESAESDVAAKKMQQAAATVQQKTKDYLAQTKQQPANLRVERSAAGATYAAGQPVQLTVRMEYGGSERITALALVEKLPAGWSFQDISEGARPVIVPAKGATGELTFVWVQVPAFPCSMSYTVLPGPNASGAQVIEGQAVYRQFGPELRSDPARTVLNPSGN